MARTLPIIALMILLCGCRSAPTPAASQPQPHEQPRGQNHGIALPAVRPAPVPPKSNSEIALRGDDAKIDDAKIMVLPGGGSYLDDLTARRESYPIEVIYELGRPLSEGRLQIFNHGQIEAEYPLSELSAGIHVTTLPQVFYWKENDETFPNADLFYNLGAVSSNLTMTDLWSARHGKSLYDYKPGPLGEKVGDPPADMAAEFRGDEQAFVQSNIPGYRNLQGRASEQLPEVEILGVGFAEGTPMHCGRGLNPEQLVDAPLHDVRVVSTVEHDSYNEIPVLKAARFTIPRAIFEYPNHIRIVGKLK